jgi:hypothetical protein
LKKELSDKMRKVREELTALPKSLADNPQSELMSLCLAFIKEVDRYTSGKPNDDPDQATFLQDASPHYQVLKQEVIRTRPQFGISTLESISTLLVIQVPVDEKELHRKATNQGNIPPFSD